MLKNSCVHLGEISQIVFGPIWNFQKFVFLDYLYFPLFGVTRWGHLSCTCSRYVTLVTPRATRRHASSCWSLARRAGVTAAHVGCVAPDNIHEMARAGGSHLGCSWLWFCVHIFHILSSITGPPVRKIISYVYIYFIFHIFYNNIHTNNPSAQARVPPPPLL